MPIPIHTKLQYIAYDKWEDRIAYDLNVFASSTNIIKLDVDDMSIDTERTQLIEGELATFGMIKVDATFDNICEAIKDWEQNHKWRSNNIVEMWQNGYDGYLRFYAIGNPLVKQI